MPKPKLDAKALRRARRINPFYKARLEWVLPAGWPSDVASSEFALRVAEVQAEHKGLATDGILGPKTWEAIQGRVWAPPAVDHLIISGERVPVGFPVVTWDEPGGLSFYGQRGWAKRRDPSGNGIGLAVLHWDACISSHQCFHVLLERGLSVQLMLDGDGTLYQALDLAEARAWHAGNFNERSVGIEIQNPVSLRLGHTQKPPRQVVKEPHVHEPGEWEHLDFYDIQKARVVEIVEVLCERFSIPRVLPTDSTGEVLRALAPPLFRGVCGHYHLSREKPDPGLTLWSGIRDAFKQPKPTRRKS